MNWNRISLFLWVIIIVGNISSVNNQVNVLNSFLPKLYYKSTTSHTFTYYSKVLSASTLNSRCVSTYIVSLILLPSPLLVSDERLLDSSSAACQQQLQQSELHPLFPPNLKHEKCFHPRKHKYYVAYKVLTCILFLKGRRRNVFIVA